MYCLGSEFNRNLSNYCGKYFRIPVSPGLSPGHTFESWYLASGTEAAGVSVDVPPSRSPGRHQTSTTVTVVDCNAFVTMARLSSRASVSGDLGGTPSRQRQQEAGFPCPPPGVCVYYCSTYYKYVNVGGGG